MADKLITELPLRSEFADTVNLPGDDTIQTYRVTGAQIRSFLEPFYKDQLAFIKNVGLQISTDSGSVEIALKQKNGTSDPTTGVNSTEISFRSSTITNPNRVIVAFDAALSLTIPSGATLGYSNGADARVFVYAYYNGTNKGLAVSARLLDEANVYSLQAIDANADAFDVYADAARTSAAVRLIGSFSINPIMTAGTWTTPTRAQGGSVPSGFFPGMVMPYAASVAPNGWLLCHGQAVSRTLFADLFAIIGITHGQGDGSTTFNLPDYRGRFLRGKANAQSTDPDRATRTAMATGGATGDNVGSVQGFATSTSGIGTNTTGNHRHDVFNNTDVSSGSNNLTSPNLYASRNYNTGGSSGYLINGHTAEPDRGLSSLSGNHSHSLTGGASETRPINAYVEFIIKY